MRNPIMPLAAVLLFGLAAPALAQQDRSSEESRTMAQNARVSVYAPATAEASRVPDAAPSMPFAYPRNPPARRIAIASSQPR
jgi:hypothetical protein